MERPQEPYHREDPDQGSFLDGFGPERPPSIDIPPMAEVTAELTEVDRARLLLEALHFAGQEKRDRFFIQVSQPDSPHRVRIEQGYGGQLPKIIEQSGDTQAATAHSAPRLFNRAKGYDTAIKEGTMTKEEAVREYDKFMWEFFDGPNAKNNRNRERTRLNNITNPPKPDATDGSA